MAPVAPGEAVKGQSSAEPGQYEIRPEQDRWPAAHRLLGIPSVLSAHPRPIRWPPPSSIEDGTGGAVFQAPPTRSLRRWRLRAPPSARASMLRPGAPI